MDEWRLFEPDYNKPMSVIVFDDGNKIHENLENTWFICGTWKGKVRLINMDLKCTIHSISKWKVVEKLFVNRLNSNPKKIMDMSSQEIP